MNKKRLIIIALAALLLISAIVIFAVIMPRFSCSKMASWDECERNPFCSPVRYMVSNDYDGPMWDCENKSELFNYFY